MLNRCYGGFGLSRKAFLKLREMGNRYALEEPDYGEGWRSDSKMMFNDFLTGIPRDDPDLIKVVEMLGEEANGEFAKLEVVEIPDLDEYYIDDYDGFERVSCGYNVWP